MEKNQTLFLSAMGAAVKIEQVDWQEALDDSQWEALFHMAMLHRVLPMVYQAVYACPAAAAASPWLMGFYRLQAMQMVALQTQKTAQFLPMREKLRESGITPMVVKGIVCRSLYPNPDHRLSSDEDILVRPEEFPACREILESMGMEAGAGEEEAHEIPFTMPGTAQLIEVHKSLFPGENEAYGDLNRFFTDIKPWMADGIPTLPPTEHMLYLILHAYKHFLHSGFGIRQVCDMVFFANAYGNSIDWARLLECCREVRAEYFAAGLLRIGRKYLGCRWRMRGSLFSGRRCMWMSRCCWRISSAPVSTATRT